MKKMTGKIISMGLAASLLFTAAPMEPAQAESIQEEALEKTETKKISESIRKTETETEKLQENMQKEQLEEISDTKGTDVNKDTPSERGEEKSNIKWKFDRSESKLIITGTGKMEDYLYDYDTPWNILGVFATSIEIGEGVTGIGNNAFCDFSIVETVSLPSTLETIGEGAFSNCSSLKEITLPSKIKKIEESAFIGCKAMENISIPDSNGIYKTQNGVLFSKDGKKLLYCPGKKTTGTYTIPSGVSEIGPMAFDSNQMSNVTIPQSVKTIGDSAFQQSGITSLVIPESVTKVGDSVCYECKNLKKVTIKPGLKDLFREVFCNCTALESVDLGKVTYFDYKVFSNCSSLKEVKIPEGTNAIFLNNFEECTSLKKVVLPASVEWIESEAFLNCTSLTEVKFSEGLKVIYEDAFLGCTSLKSVQLPSSIKEIGKNAFPSTTKLNNKPEGLEKQEDGTYAIRAQVKITGKEVYAEAFEVLKKVNSERKKAGKKSLKMDKELLDAAMKRAMETSIYWSHTRPNGSSCFTASDLMSGENIAVGPWNASGVMSMWMKSAGHKANILDEDYTTIGIGCVEISGGRYWVQCFGRKGSKTVQSGDYKNKNKTRTISVNSDKEYYRPTIQVNGSKVKAGKTLQVSVAWHNGFSTIKIPASNLKYSSSDKSVCTVSKGTIKGVGNGTAKIKIWFPGYEKGAVTKKITVSGGVQKKTYTVKFDKNGGTKLSKSSLKVAQGAKIGKLPTVQRKGYDFKGWYTKKSKGTRVTKKTVIKKNQTLYAQWSKVKKPGSTKITSLKKKSGVMTVTYKRVKGAGGYEISYSTSKKFVKNSTKKTSEKSLKKNIRNLKKGKTYYVRVRAYKTDSAKTKIYGTYSKVKQIKM